MTREDIRENITHARKRAAAAQSVNDVSRALDWLALAREWEETLASTPERVPDGFARIVPPSAGEGEQEVARIIIRIGKSGTCGVILDPRWEDLRAFAGCSSPAVAASIGLQLLDRYEAEKAGDDS